MSELSFEGEQYVLDEGESVLTCLERHGVGIPNSCRSGVCHSCLMRSVSGELPSGSQKGLKDTLQAQGYFLSCLCTPEQGLEVARADDAIGKVGARIAEIVPLNDRVIRVLLETDEPLSYFPGQFVNFVRGGDVVRSYSLASVPGIDSRLECHVALVPNGVMSGWLHDEAAPGDGLELMGPLGNCFYVAGKAEQPLFLLGTGTGLAPLYGIARDALHQGHEGAIHLFHGALKRDDLYLVDELRALDEAHATFHYHPCVRDEAVESWVKHGNVDEIALKTVGDLKGWKVYLCGDPGLIRLVQRSTFMAGASMQDILSDAFLPAGGASS